MKFLVADGYGLDRALAALFLGAKGGETVSLMAARADAGGKRWGCILCRALGVLVERDHCKKVLVSGDGPTPLAPSYRAGVLLYAAGGLLWSLPYVLVWAFRAMF